MDRLDCLSAYITEYVLNAWSSGTLRLRREYGNVTLLATASKTLSLKWIYLREDWRHACLKLYAASTITLEQYDLLLKKPSCNLTSSDFNA